MRKMSFLISGLLVLTFSGAFVGSTYAQDNNINATLNNKGVTGDYQSHKTTLISNDEEYKSALKSVFLLDEWKPFFENLDTLSNSKPFLNNEDYKDVTILKIFKHSDKMYILYNIKNEKTGENRDVFTIVNDKTILRENLKIVSKTNSKTNLNEFLKWKLKNINQDEYENVKYVPVNLAMKLQYNSVNINDSVLRILHYLLPSVYAFSNTNSSLKEKILKENNIYQNYNFVFVSNDGLLGEQVLNEFKKRTYRIDNNYYEGISKDIIATTNHYFKDLVDVEIPTGDYSNAPLINLGDFKGVPFITSDRFFYVVLTDNGIISKEKTYTVLPYIFNDKEKTSNIIQKANTYGIKRNPNSLEYKNRYGNNFWIERLGVDYLKINNSDVKTVLGKNVFPETAERMKEDSLETRKDFKIMKKQKDPKSNYTLLIVENLAKGDFLKQDFYVLQNAKEYNLSASSDSYFLWKIEDLNKLIKEKDISINSFPTPPKVISKTEADNILKKDMPAEYFTFLYNSSVYALIEDAVDKFGFSPTVPDSVFNSSNISVVVDSKLNKFDRKSQKYTEYVYELNGAFFEFASDDKFNSEISLKDFFNSKHVRDYKKRIF